MSTELANLFRPEPPQPGKAKTPLGYAKLFCRYQVSSVLKILTAIRRILYLRRFALSLSPTMLRGTAMPAPERTVISSLRTNDRVRRGAIRRNVITSAKS
jgi:hypothetical protein